MELSRLSHTATGITFVVETAASGVLVTATIANTATRDTAAIASEALANAALMEFLDDPLVPTENLTTLFPNCLPAP